MAATCTRQWFLTTPYGFKVTAICKKGNGTGDGMGEWNGEWNGESNYVHLLFLASVELCFKNRFFRFLNNLSYLEHSYLK